MRLEWTLLCCRCIRTLVVGDTLDKVWNHVQFRLSANDMRMVRSVPQGGNWRDIPLDIPSKRLEQIRKSGGRTTLYGRLRLDRPSFTINTYINRPGNGTHIHPLQDRVLTIREAARLQTFPDSVRFHGSAAKQLKQVGNAVPPLLGRAVGMMLREMNQNSRSAVDLFAGAGGLSLGLEWAGFRTICASDFDVDAAKTYQSSHESTPFVIGDITKESVKDEILQTVAGQPVDLLAGGPPCQGFSMAGKRMIDDPRNALFKEFLNIAATLSPALLLMENVSGILSMEKGQTLQSIKSALAEIGYQSRVVQLNAVEYSCPQRRKRVFIIASRAEELLGRLNPKHQFCEVPLTVADAISDLPEPNATEPVEITSNPHSGFQSWARGHVSTENYLLQRDSLSLSKGLFD